jgi:SPP1 gp7 family putative phage head morphogenesis protein
MAYSLARLIALRQSPRSRKRIFTVPPVAFPLYLERELLVLQVRLLRAWEAAYRQHVLPHYDPPAPGQTQDTVPGLEAGIDAAEGDLRRLLLILTPELADWVVKVERYHRGQFADQVKTATGVDLETTIGLAAATETMSVVLARVTSLVTGMSDDARKKLADIVWAGFTNRTPRNAMARQLRDALQISRSRAVLIARDQTVKLAATLDQERQTEAGIKRYRWRHSRKARPRKEHVVRDGLLFWWSKPPYDGHPGVAINCGCKPEAYIDLDDLP